ncbi:aminotransferase class V-fold PLP-dependent enzyme [Taibaiella soli]|uniref:aminotransferase class V-fold PLP-dependent enzyme n=1 Tax=Taibaiella soli TaxID=1649169 RepID=UPI001403DC5D|nr:aminotransferase class V-fold PLP-dependent enzyme [Taibaiella soli]
MSTKTYLNTAACGLLDEGALQQTNAFYQAMLTESSTASEIVRDKRIPEIRENLASFLGASASEIAFVPNFSYALNCIVQALKGTEKVLLFKTDYPSVYEPFRINNFDITWIEVEADGFTINTDVLKEKLLQEKIDLLVISHVQWLSGFKLNLVDIGTFCKKHKIIFIVDATQSLGAIEINMGDIHADVLIASNYKWMNAGFGTGVMYMSESFMQGYPPVIGGNNSYTIKDGIRQYVPSVRSFEPGHTNLHALLILDATVQFKRAKGVAAIEAHNRQLTQQLLDNVPDDLLVGPKTLENRSSIVYLKADKQLQDYLTENNIVVTRLDSMVRVSMHFYNTPADVAVLTDCLKAYRIH